MLHVPTVKEFEKKDYLDAPELRTIAERLISEDGSLEWILSLRMAYLWKKTAPKSRGRAVLGQVQRTPKMLRHFYPNAEWVIQLSADQFVEAGALAIERTILHEMLHLVENPKTGKATLRPHDIETFEREEQKYGRAD